MQVQESIVMEELRESVIKSLGDVLLDEFSEADDNLDANQSPFDSKLDIKFIGKEFEEAETDDTMSVHNEEFSKDDANAFADKPPQSDPFGHHLADFSSLVALSYSSKAIHTTKPIHSPEPNYTPEHTNTNTHPSIPKPPSPPL
nr:hypothetical protein [Tanacetum cinerariifolium]